MLALGRRLADASRVQTLFLDVTGEDGLIACVDEGGVRVSEAIDRKVRDAGLMEAAVRCVDSAGWDWQKIGSIACVLGPGGFMSIRVAVAFTNALSWARKIPAAGFHGSDVVAARLSSLSSPKSPLSFIWVHSTKSLEVFARGFGRYTSIWPEPVHLKLEEMLAGMPKGAPFAGDVLPAHAEALIAAGHERLALRPLRDVVQELLKTAEWKQEQLVPWYGRQG